MRVGITGHRGLSADVERQVRDLLDSAVRGGGGARGCGGTADVVAYAGRTGVPVRILWPEGASR
ncbi:hypothetical protein ACFXPI_28065 [Streptomyces sp. NPDC059104]|uniref:hypothetical protein n=1 Tax=Streptomyces sp. NPDC059104 TaxID=3346729 RepID=UPI003696B206